MSADIWATNGGVYFGHKVPLPGEGVNPLTGAWSPSRETNSHRGEGQIVTIGPSGSGKSRRLLLPNLYRLTDWSMLVIDPKGTLAMLTAAHRKAKGGDIITLDPFGAIPAKWPGAIDHCPELRSIGLNPLAALDPTGPRRDYFADDAKRLSEAMIQVEGKDPHWSRSAQALAAGLMMAARLEHGAEADLARVRKWISLDVESLGLLLKSRNVAGGDGSKVKSPPGLIDDWGKDYPGLAAKLQRFANIDPSSNELLSVLGTAITQTDWLDSILIQEDMARASNAAERAARMKDRPVTIYLVLPPDFLETHATWLRLMITTILLPLLRTESGKVPVMLMLDEFAQLGRLEVIEQNMALIREYGIKLWVVLQDLTQLSDLYEKRWESFIGNAGALHAFAPQDKTTRDYLSELSGKKFYELTTQSGGRSTNFGGQFSQGQSEGTSTQHQLGPVWWPQDLGRMAKEKERGVLFFGGEIARAWFPDPSEMHDVLPGMKTNVAELLRAALAAARG